jgi:uncharacterized Zn-finger protein
VPAWSSDIFDLILPLSPLSPRDYPLRVTIKNEMHLLSTEHLPFTPLTSPPSSSLGERYECGQCHRAFSKRFKLTSHEKTVHVDEIDKFFICKDNNCRKRFVRLHDLQRHDRIHTHEKLNVCKYCQRKFSRADALKRHLHPTSPGTDRLCASRGGRGSYRNFGQEKIES